MANLKTIAELAEGKTKEALKILKRLSRSEFSSKTHYLYYKQYVMPKILSKDYGHTIYLAENYIVLKLRNIKYKTVYTYLLGLDNSGKLFVNKLAIDPNITSLVGYDDKSDTYIYTTTDKDIYRLLGYNEQMDGQEEITISDGTYRVQGEIMLSVTKINDNEDMYIILKDSMTFDITTYARLLLLDKINIALNNIGFNTEIEEGRIEPNIIITGAYRRDDKNVKDKLVKLAHKLIVELNKYIPVKLINIDVKNWGPYVAMYLSNDKFGEFRIEINVTLPPYGQKYGNARVRISITNNAPIITYLKNDLLNELKKLQKTEFEFALGNHLVKLKNVISSNITYTPPIKPLTIQTRVLSNGGTEYFVFNDSEIMLKHNEHGETRIKFNGIYIIRFMTTNINRDYNSEINRIVFNNL